MKRSAPPPPTSLVTPEIRRWVETWREADRALSLLKRETLRQLETREALRQLADAFDLAVATAPRTSTSGLVDQQRLFQRLRT